MPNRLAGETSPYLLQHSDNPVDWYPWGEEALTRARKHDRPILLSVGYSACHWCHVMERECFEDDGIASLMNEHFVNIKVDREERPDIDGIYMQAVQAMTGRGGWPMTVFLLPDGRPFFGGTYFPPADRDGMPGFPRVLLAVARAFREQRDALVEHGERLVRGIEAAAPPTETGRLLTEAPLHQAAASLRERYDPHFGGFGRAPKFPNAAELDFAFRYQHRFVDRDLFSMALHTLRAMAKGGIRDHLGGGFHRYSTDARWLVPHFEKMLYDNAQLAATYIDAFLLTRDRLFEAVARETLDYLLREMNHEAGGFFAAQDADSGGEEGRFFTWTPEEIDAVLGADDGRFLREFHGVTGAGNFEGRNVLHVPVELEEFARSRGLPPEEAAERLDSARHRLYRARAGREHPARDEKVLTAWNGMLLKALARASRTVDGGGVRYRQAAVRAAEFLLRGMRSPSGRLLRTWRDGRAGPPAYLEDYAWLIDGLIATYEATFTPRYLEAAMGLAREMLALFWDGEIGACYDTGRDHEALITRPRDLFDTATPAGNSVAADVLLKLAILFAEPDYERRAASILQGLAPYMERAPAGFPRALCALDFYLGPRRELALAWEGGSDPGPLIQVAFGAYRPGLVTVAACPEGTLPIPLLEARTAIDGRPAAYVCERYVCQLPVTGPEALAAQLG